MESEFIYFYISTFAYAFFLLLAILLRIGKGNSQMGKFNQLHLIFTLFYFLNSFFFAYLIRDINPREILRIGIGLFCYFLIHYAYFLNFFALSQRSISSSILKILYENGDLNLKQIDEKYASGVGFKHIQISRLDDMEKLKWIKRDSGKVVLLNSGKSIQKFVKSVLKIFGLKQIGDE